jgi:hypothetical protein
MLIQYFGETLRILNVEHDGRFGCVQVACVEGPRQSIGTVCRLFPTVSMEVLSQDRIVGRLVADLEPAVGMRVCYPEFGEFTITDVDERTGRIGGHQDSDGCDVSLWAVSAMFVVSDSAIPARSFVFMQRCVECGEYEYVDRMRTTHDGEAICLSCYEDEYFTCNRCGEIFRIGESYITDTGSCLCEGCYVELYTSCERCGTEMPMVDSLYDMSGDRRLCVRCYDECVGHDDEEDEEDEEEHSAYIRRHGSKLPTVFHGNDSEMFYGMELEFECEDAAVEQVAEAIYDPAETDWYLERDNSLDHGIEVVAHARTFRSWQAFWPSYDKRLLRVARRMGCSGHGYGTCGLHIHTSLAAWEDSQLYRVFQLLYDPVNYQDLLVISQRRESALTQWASLRLEDLGSHKDTIESKQSPFENRYAALNITRHTLEVRLFNSNLRLDRVRKNMEFVHALYYYTKGVRWATWEGLMRWIQRHRKTEKNLYGFLLEKGIITQEEKSVCAS